MAVCCWSGGDEQTTGFDVQKRRRQREPGALYYIGHNILWISLIFVVRRREDIIIAWKRKCWAAQIPLRGRQRLYLGRRLNWYFSENRFFNLSQLNERFKSHLHLCLPKNTEISARPYARLSTGFTFINIKKFVVFRTLWHKYRVVRHQLWVQFVVDGGQEVRCTGWEPPTDADSTPEWVYSIAQSLDSYQSDNDKPKKRQKEQVSK